VNRMAEVALRHPCVLGFETAHPRYKQDDPIGLSIVLTVNTGYE
jgi:hypothetical protein